MDLFSIGCFSITCIYKSTDDSTLIQSHNAKYSITVMYVSTSPRDEEILITQPDCKKVKFYRGSQGRNT